MTADAVVKVIVMDHEAGAWCPSCSLPSGFRVTYAIGWTLQTFVRCVECCEPIP